jgi:hypothetical protein
VSRAAAGTGGGGSFEDDPDWQHHQEDAEDEIHVERAHEVPRRMSMTQAAMMTAAAIPQPTSTPSRKVCAGSQA